MGPWANVGPWARAPCPGARPRRQLRAPPPARPRARAHGPTWAHIISQARCPRPILINIYIYMYRVVGSIKTSTRCMSLFPATNSVRAHPPSRTYTYWSIYIYIFRGRAGRAPLTGAGGAPPGPGPISYPRQGVLGLY